MNPIRKTILLVKELGLPNLFAYGKYQLLLRSGMLERLTPPGGTHGNYPGQFKTINFPLQQITTDQFQKFPKGISVYGETNDLLTGIFRPFGGNPSPITLNLPGQALKHWSKYSHQVAAVDIKMIWEPARFTWVLELVKSYLLTGDERIPTFYWQKVEEFLSANPVNLGPNWASAQEISLRMINWILSLGIFRESPIFGEEKLSKLLGAIWEHARRIPLTLDYARSQNNNHLLSEALGMILAGELFKKRSALVDKWLIQGVRDFEDGILHQVEDDGTYAQHSSNYHRMMLQLALLYHAWAKRSEYGIPEKVLRKLSAATVWLLAQMDPVTGTLPNLGHNDGTLILPFGCEDYGDYRPTAQAAALAFNDAPALPPGRWDELAAWLGLGTEKKPQTHITPVSSPAVHKVSSGNTWGTLRGVIFHGRPAHADQLHVDLWWDGINIAQDAGSYLYNADAPWDNSLARTRVHNTLTIDDQDQMTRGGRFLWLGQANAQWQTNEDTRILTALHDGYKELGYVHKRTLEILHPDVLEITDDLTKISNENRERQFTLHWLLPDWEWSFNYDALHLKNAKRQMIIAISVIPGTDAPAPQQVDCSIVRGGVRLSGKREDPTLGWGSHTYNQKVPALSYSLTLTSSSNFTLKTTWDLQKHG